MTKWEYRVVEVGRWHSAKDEDDLLVVFGLDGWELASSRMIGERTHYIFKRPLPQGDAVLASALCGVTKEANHE